MNGVGCVTMASGATDVGPLLAANDAVASYAAAVAQQRSRLRAAWLSASEDVERAQAQIQAIGVTLTRRRAELDQLIRDFAVRRAIEVSKYPVSLANVDRWLDGNGSGGWTVYPGIEKEFDSAGRNAQLNLEEYRKKAFGGGLWRAGMKSVEKFAEWVARLTELQRVLDSEVKRATAERSRLMAQECANAGSALDPVRMLVAEAMGRLPAPLQPWDSPVWAKWSAQPTVSDLAYAYAGTLIPLNDDALGEYASFGTAERLPLFLPRRSNLEIVHGAGSREQALSMARSLLLRQLADVNPGDLRFCLKKKR